MSLRKKLTEIQRLKDAFEKEAQKFHNLRFSQFFVTQVGPIENGKFVKPNHCIMLWQYYGKANILNNTQSFVNDLQESDFKWGIKGAELSAFGVLEGGEVDLFVRMAKRAGSLFNDKESYIIKSQVIQEIIEKEKSGNFKPTAVVNDNPLSIWLNYLLYYISKVSPLRSKSTVIEPDPFSLSLLALERLAEDPYLGKVDKSSSRLEDLKFSVALSFPGEKRLYVSKVADTLRSILGKDRLFYDFDYQSQLARPDLDILLQKIYRQNASLIVVFLCAEYSKKEWCGLEWRAIRDIIKSKDIEKIMIVRFDDADIEGLFSIDGYINANKFTPNEVAEFILERVR